MVTVSKEAAGSQLRWGNLATFSSVGLLGIVGLALVAPTIAVGLIGLVVFLVALVYGLSKVVLKVPALRIAVLRLMLQHVNKISDTSDIYRFYLGIIGVLGGKKPRLYSLQPALPHLPVPPLEETCEKYLKTIQPLLTEAEFEKSVAAVEEFKMGVGKTLQEQLVKRAADPKIENWLEEWWESFIYLRGRDPLPVFSNWYGTDRINSPEQDQAVRGSKVISEILVFKKMCETEELEPIRLAGTVPFCMWQYTRIFATTRIPGEAQDQLITKPLGGVRHIIVFRKGQIWKLTVVGPDGRIQGREVLRKHLAEIISHDNDAGDKQLPIGVLTAQKRPNWHEARQQLIEEGNAAALEVVESALFVVALDDEALPTLEEEALTSCYRNATNRWYDKSFQMIIFKNGRLGVNVEHTWADAPVMVHMFDFIFGIEDAAEPESPQVYVSEPISTPELLKWKSSSKIEQAIEEAKLAAHALEHNSIELKVLVFEAYGKGFIKQLKVSPDGFVQMAIQLAYYKLYDKLVLTYESSHTRQFLHGRTETVRSASMAALEFVKAMQDRLVPAKEKLRLLRAAIEGHVAYMKECMAGKGVDRHLLGLYIQSKLLGMPTPSLFADKGWQQEFILATSQTPGLRTTGGGFAPMTPQGYGVSYLVAEERLTFHITCVRANPDTSSERFFESLKDSLNQMRSISVVTSEMRRSLSQGELPQA